MAEHTLSFDGQPDGEDDENAAGSIERPQCAPAAHDEFGSDAIARLLRELDFPFIALNPGSSYRGLHDSLVNYLGNAAPQMLLCLHEEHAVALAHGWAKVTGKPLAVALHANVGLMHASMAIFNAWCDRVPMLILGGVGPVDAALRRPWIDWIHTARDQAAIVRGFVKWDDQPSSAKAAIESVLRANLMTRTAPTAPTYVALDTTLQESRIDTPLTWQVARHQPAALPAPAPDALQRAAAALSGATRPVILIGRGDRNQAAWNRRVALAEALGALVLTDLKLPSSFPTDHPRHAAPAGLFVPAAGLEVLRQADVVLALDWVDLAGTLDAAWKGDAIDAQIVAASLDYQLHNALSMDHQALPPLDVALPCDADTAVASLLDVIQPREADATWPGWEKPAPPAINAADGPLRTTGLAAALLKAVEGRATCLIRTPLSWAGGMWPANHPLDLLGSDGGGGIGSGLGMTVGAAMALAGSDRLPIAVLGDGDFVMGVAAIWTATHYRVAGLVVVANNASFFNDEMHQDRVARDRGRLVENRWIGQRISGPDLDIAGLARAQGATAFGPVTRYDDLADVFAAAIARVDAGEFVVVDVRIEAGYDASFNAAVFERD